MAHGERSGFLHVDDASKAPYAPDVLAQLHADAAEVLSRYPHKRSALLPLLHLVQSVDGYVTGRGVEFCAEVLELTTAEVSGVATFYTQYKRHPNGEYTVGVCTNTLCAVMGGDQIFDTLVDHLGIGHDETTADGKVTLERIECNAACDYAPVIMTNWEFFDNQTPESAVALVDDLQAGRPVRPTRGADTVCTFKQVSRVLAGFHDGRADEGVGAGRPSVLGLEIARERGWAAPGDKREDGRGTQAGPAASGSDAGGSAAGGEASQSAASKEGSEPMSQSTGGQPRESVAPHTGHEHSSADAPAGAPTAKREEVHAEQGEAPTIRRPDSGGDLGGDDGTAPGNHESAGEDGPSSGAADDLTHRSPADDGKPTLPGLDGEEGGSK